MMTRRLSFFTKSRAQGWALLSLLLCLMSANAQSTEPLQSVRVLGDNTTSSIPTSTPSSSEESIAPADEKTPYIPDDGTTTADVTGGDDGQEEEEEGEVQPFFAANQRESAIIRLDFHFFSDADLSTMKEPTLGVYQALSCQTDLYLTSILQERIGKVVLLSLQMVDWTFDNAKESPLSIKFIVEAYEENDGGAPVQVHPVEIVKAVDNASYREYIMGFVWNTYPIGATDTEMLRQTNKISYDATVRSPGQQESSLLYDTTVCPALSLVASTWQIGFYEEAFIGDPSPADFIALACQMYTFVAELLIEKYMGTNVDTVLQSVYWQFYAPDSKGFALDVTVDIKAEVTHSNGRKTPVPSAVIGDVLNRADYNTFITSYMHQEDYWGNVQRLDIHAEVKDVTVGEKVNWESDGPDGCPRVTPPPTLTPLTPRPTSATVNRPVQTPITPRPAPTETPARRTPAPTPELVVMVEPEPAPRPVQELPAMQTRPPRSTPSPTTEPPPLPQGPIPQEPVGEPASEPAAATTTGTETDASFMDWCRRALFEADVDGNKLLNAPEYVLLLNLLGDSAYEGYPFVALPMELKNNFDNWVSEEAQYQIELEAMLKAAPARNEEEVDGAPQKLSQQGPKQEQEQDRNPLEQQQAHRDAICEGTHAALQQAAATEHPSPVRLRITTRFLAYNHEGLKTKEEFWDNSDDLTEAYIHLLTDYVASRMLVFLKGGRRQQLRQRTLTETQYWVMPDSVSIYQVRETDCPDNTPGDASCLQPSAKYEVFVLTPTPDDTTDSDAIRDAAKKATQEGISNGILQKSLIDYNPNSPWSVKSTDQPTPAPNTPRPTRRPVPSGPDVDRDSGLEIVYVDDDNLDGVVLKTNATKHVTDVQCGGDVGMAALNATGIECDSFAGKHIWHIIVGAGLAVFMCLVFMPLLIWGRYPCCGSNQPKTMARLVGSRRQQAMNKGMMDHTKMTRSGSHSSLDRHRLGARSGSNSSGMTTDHRRIRSGTKSSGFERPPRRGRRGQHR